MIDQSKFERSGALWWVPSKDGAMRRIWVRKSGEAFLCARELCSPEQEQARTRIFRADAANEPPALEDLRCWCEAHFAQLRTVSAAEAWVFLGADELAQCALEDCDPSLADAFVPDSPCEVMDAVHKVELR